MIEKISEYKLILLSLQKNENKLHEIFKKIKKNIANSLEW
jgi:hypothetical protein